MGKGAKGGLDVITTYLDSERPPQREKCYKVADYAKYTKGIALRLIKR